MQETLFLSVDAVTTGTLLAVAGKTGHAEGEHIHCHLQARNQFFHSLETGRLLRYGKSYTICSIPKKQNGRYSQDEFLLMVIL